MLKKLLFWVAIGLISGVNAQEITTSYQNKKVVANLETIRIDSIGLNPSYFKVIDKLGNEIGTEFYKIDFATGKLILKDNFPTLNDSITINYLKLPDYLSREYSIYDKSRIVENDVLTGQLYQTKANAQKRFVPFDGLTTVGSITRGVTVGNNQNTVVNSSLDLQITGKISDKVSIRASIQDTNIPLQEGGYSQKLDEFDQIFIELFSDKWAIRAGDLFLENRKSRFLNFNKKVQGISTQFEFGDDNAKTTIFGAAALVRGQYAKSNFIGQEGNQGPYKLRGPNGELYILVISGSERVYVNGILMKRGENNDYIIDYNAGEIIFTSLFPITSEMRIVIEYQYSDRKYTRFVTYAGATHEREKWSISGAVYSENDIKNQPLQQNLSSEQAQLLVGAGDNLSLMTAPSAFVDSYSENKILYRKTFIGTEEIFEFSTNPDEELYNVRFTLVGTNLGNYTLVNNATVGRIYEYVAPINDVKQGNYDPIVRLAAPTKIQIATVMGTIDPSEKTHVDFEIGVSNNDLNLFSNLDDSDNKGLAGKVKAKQRLFSKIWEIDATADFQFIQKDFRTIERLFNIEFDRDWNLSNPKGNQSLLISGLNFALPEKGALNYQFEKLDFSESFSGSRHVVQAFFKLKNFTIQNNGSYLKSDGDYAKSTFARNFFKGKYHFDKNWVGATMRAEDNREIIKATENLSALSQKFTEFGAFIGRGDSTKVYVEVGYLNRVNDSLQNGFLQKVNTSNSFYVKSRIIQNQKTNLSLFANYRRLKYVDGLRPDEPSINSRLLYNDRFFDDFMQITTAYETSSGTLAQQEFTYLEVDPGQGVYKWNDYNGNGIQELDEFEVAQFSDEAKYVKIFLPSQIFVKTHQNKISQSVTLNPIQWQNSTGFRKILSSFFNQTSFLSDRKIRRDENSIDFNPFSSDDDQMLGINSSFRNSLFFNRGKQYHSVTYNLLRSRSKNLLSFATQSNTNESHQLQYSHLIRKSWLFNLGAKTISNSTLEKYFNSSQDSVSGNIGARNYKLQGYQISPKVSYLFSKNANVDIFFDYQYKENRLGSLEMLAQKRFGTSFTYASDKQFTANGEISFYDNLFTGNMFSPVAYQMLEGLQPGKNMTWRLLVQKNLTQFLDINVNYQGRKSETTKAIHTGSVQLRAYF